MGKSKEHSRPQTRWVSDEIQPSYRFSVCLVDFYTNVEGKTCVSYWFVEEMKTFNLICFNDLDILLVDANLQVDFFTPTNEVKGGILVSVCLSVCLSDCLSPSVDMILSSHVLRNGCTDFSENLYTQYSPSEDVCLYVWNVSTTIL